LQHHHLVIFGLDQDCLPEKRTQHAQSHLNHSIEKQNQNYICCHMLSSG
jgi:hypothetical protein